MATPSLSIAFNPAQSEAIVRNKYKYVWRIKYRDGEVVEQLGADGAERKLDFLRPVEEVAWVPARSGLQEAAVTLKPGQQPVLARRTFQMMNGTTFIASYLIGAEQLQADGTLRRKVWFLSPPAEGIILDRESDKKVPITIKFPGAVEETEDHLNFQSAAQRWMSEQKPLIAV